MKKVFLAKGLPVLLIILVAGMNPLRAQSKFTDSLQVNVGTQLTLASQDYQPLWIESNRFGTIADRGSDASTFVTFKNKHEFLTAYDLEEGKSFGVGYGLSLYNNDHFNKTFLEEGYARIWFNKFQLTAGRFEERSSDIDNELTSGGFGISGNSLPIPKISIGTSDYVVIPFADGLFQFKGTFAHGWFGNDRFMKNALYHEKTFYLRVGRNKLKFYGGLQHFAEWGGSRGKVRLNRDFDAFLDVVLVREADDGSVGTAINGLRPSRAGDQRGLLEVGGVYENDLFQLQGYAQMPFESGEEVDIRNHSVLAGANLSLKKEKKTGLQKLVVQLIYTKDMNDFVRGRQRQSYYNNGYYKTGWTYQDRIIGTPLFTDRNRAQHYFPEIQPYDWDAPTNTIQGNRSIINNRVFGGHVGIGYGITDQLSARTRLTFTRNYGDLRDDSPFLPSKTELYTMQEVDFTPEDSRFTTTLGLAVDIGDLSKNVGGLLKVSYRIF